MPTYYLAGSFNDKKTLRDLIIQVHRESEALKYPGGPWVCNSRWIAEDTKQYTPGETREDRAEHGYMDLADIDNAHAVVITNGRSVGGGKWVELGYALAIGKPILYWEVQGLIESEHLNLFVYNKKVTWVANIRDLVRRLYSISIIGGEAYVPEQD